jgi:ubiquinone/menaquinone biosynthesis C-methylase UbiE
MDNKGTNTRWTGSRARRGGRMLNSSLRKYEDALFGRGSSVLLREAKTALNGEGIVLDCGSGSGYLSIPIARALKKGEVICLDASADMLEVLKAKAAKAGVEGRIRILVADATETGLDDEAVDMVVSSNVLHELFSPQEALKEWARVLKPGGLMILVDFADTRFSRMFMHHSHGGAEHGPFSADLLSEAMREAGLEEVQVEKRRSQLVASARRFTKA